VSRGATRYRCATASSCKKGRRWPGGVLEVSSRLSRTALPYLHALPPLCRASRVLRHSQRDVCLQAEVHSWARKESTPGLMRSLRPEAESDASTTPNTAWWATTGSNRRRLTCWVYLRTATTLDYPTGPGTNRVSGLFGADDSSRSGLCIWPIPAEGV